MATDNEDLRKEIKADLNDFRNDIKIDFLSLTKQIGALTRAFLVHKVQTETKFESGNKKFNFMESDLKEIKNDLQDHVKNSAHSDMAGIYLDKDKQEKIDEILKWYAEKKRTGELVKKSSIDGIIRNVFIIIGMIGLFFKDQILKIIGIIK